MRQINPKIRQNRLLAASSSRRRFIKTLSGLGMACTLPACDVLADKPIAVAAHIWVGYEPMFLAQREGWLDGQRVQLVETNTATESLKALAEGRVHGAALTLDEVLKARQDGQRLTVVMAYNISSGADMLVARSTLTNLADLKGKRIGYEQSSVSELLLSIVLRKAGLARSDVTLLPISVDKQLDAWRHNELDAAVTYEPVAGALLAQGGRNLFDSRQIPNTIIDVLAIRSDMIDRHASSIRHLVQSQFKALDHLTRNPHDAAYRMASHLKLKAADVLPAFKGLVPVSPTYNRQLLTGEKPELLETARKLSAVMVAHELLTRDDALDALFRADLLPAAVANR